MTCVDCRSVIPPVSRSRQARGWGLRCIRCRPIRGVGRVPTRGPRPCQHCGVVVQDATRVGAFSCSPCKLQIKRNAHHQRRALRRTGTLPTHKVLLTELFVRFGGRCALCSKPVPMLVSSKDGLSPSIDHIVPISRGGLHTHENVQLAHLACNGRKGDRTYPGTPIEPLNLRSLPNPTVPLLSRVRHGVN